MEDYKKCIYDESFTNSLQKIALVWCNVYHQGRIELLVGAYGAQAGVEVLMTLATHLHTRTKTWTLQRSVKFS